MSYTPGLFEFRVTFSPRGGGDTVETMTTPSIYALADEWADTLRAAGSHTDDWIERQLGGAVFLLAAQDLGIAPAGPITLSAIAEILNAYDVDMETPDGDGQDPTPAAREGAPATP